MKMIKIKKLWHFLALAIINLLPIYNIHIIKILFPAFKKCKINNNKSKVNWIELNISYSDYIY